MLPIQIGLCLFKFSMMESKNFN